MPASPPWRHDDEWRSTTPNPGRSDSGGVRDAAAEMKIAYWAQ